MVKVEQGKVNTEQELKSVELSLSFSTGRELAAYHLEAVGDVTVAMHQAENVDARGLAGLRVSGSVSPAFASLVNPRTSLKLAA